MVVQEVSHDGMKSNQRRKLWELKQNDEVKQSFAPNDAFVLFFVNGGDCFHVQNIKVLPLSASFRGGCCALIGPLTNPRFKPNRIQSGIPPTDGLSLPNASSNPCIVRAFVKYPLTVAVAIMASLESAE